MPRPALYRLPLRIKRPGDSTLRITDAVGYQIFCIVYEARPHTFDRRMSAKIWSYEQALEIAQITARALTDAAKKE